MAFGDVPRPTGPAAEQLVWSQWPEMSESDLGDLAAKYVALAKAANAYGDQLMRGMTRDRELLKGYAGDAHQTLMGTMRDHAYAVADHFDTKAATAKAYKEIIFGLKTTLTRIAEAAEKDWNAAHPASRGVVIAKYAPEVESAVADAWSDFNAAPAPSAPPKSPIGTPTKPGAENNGSTIRTVENRTDQPPVPDATDSDAPSGVAKVDSDSAIPDATDSDAPSGVAKVDSDSAIPDATDSDAPSGAPKVDSPITGTPGNGTGVSQMPSMPAGVPSMGGSSPSVPSSSLGSASGLMKPSALSGGALSSGGVSPSAPTSPQGLGAGGSSSPLANATKSFGSGLSSGFGGATGAVPPPSMGRAEPLVGQPVSAQPGSPQPASAPSVATHGGPSAATPAPTGGGVGGGGMGGGALAPFVPPGGHAPPPPPVPPSSPTAAASPSAPAGGAQPGGQQSGSAGPAMVASASGGTTAGMLPDEADNPDLAVAKRVLTGLVIGTSAAPDPIVLDWAVSVLNTSIGKQVVIASSMGGGGYIPPTVFLPADARLAVTDQSLPMGWAALYTGWPAPVDIVVAHSEKLSEHLAGVSISAIAATNSGQSSAYRPSGVTDYLTLSLADVLKDGNGTAPVFGGGYQHRMTSVDPDLARRLSMLDRGGDISTHIATQVTIAVATAAQQETPRLIDPVDLNTLAALGDGATVDWAEHYRQVCGRENNAMFYPSVVAQPSDLDESVTSVNIRAVYQHYYRMGRMVELVRCWRHSPVSVLDIGYCAYTAGFGATVSEALVPWERHFNGGGAQ